MTFVYFDVKKCPEPEKYVDATRRICKAMGDHCKIHFIPSRRSWVPYHVKLDTETVLKIFTPTGKICLRTERISTMQCGEICSR